MVAALAARAGDLSARADLTWADEETDVTSNQYFRQRYELELRQPVSDAIQYSFRLRLTEDQGESTIGPTSADLHRREALGQANLAWGRENYGLVLRHELGWSGDVEGLRASGNERRAQRSTVGGRWRVSAPLELAAGWEHLDVTASSPRRPTSSDRLSTTVSLTLPSQLRATEENRLERTDDGTNERTALGPRVTFDWSRELGADTSASAHYAADWSWIRERNMSGTPAPFAIELTVVAGLYERDDTPNDTSTTPLQPAPALVDRNFATSTGISIGPAGLSFQNIALDMGRVVTVDGLTVDVRSSTGNPVPFAGPIAWTAWWSNDGATWARAGGESTAFDPALSAYVVSFLPATARYFKVVNFGTNTVDTVVTELQAFVHETLSTGMERRISALLQTVQAALAFRPWERLRIIYAGTLNALATSTDGAANLWSTDSSHALSARAGPFDDVTITADVNRWDARAPGAPAQHNLASALTVAWRPLPRAEAAAVVRAGELSPEGASATTWGAGLRGQLGWYEAIRLAAGIDYGHDRFSAGSNDYVNGQATAALRVRPDLDLGAAIGVQRVTESAGTSPGAALALLTVYQYERYQAEAVYRPGEPLQVDFRLGYYQSAMSSGLLQVLRLTWSPFRGSAVSVVAEYDDDVDPLSGRRFQRLQLFPRWNLNRHAVLQLNYNRTRASGAGASRQDVLYLTFTMRT
jgi:hypothetical protein